jgi:hypothetical protein
VETSARPRNSKSPPGISSAGVQPWRGARAQEIPSRCLEFLVRESSCANDQKRVCLEIFPARTGISSVGGQQFGEKRQPRNSRPLPRISNAGMGTYIAMVGR